MQSKPARSKVPSGLENFPFLSDQAAVRLPIVIAVTGLGRSSIYRLEREGLFPHRVRLGPHSVAWNVGELRRWLQTRVVQS